MTCAKKNRGTRRLVLGDRNGLGQVHIDLEAFFEFSFWLAEELEDLVSRHEMNRQLVSSRETLPPR